MYFKLLILRLLSLTLIMATVSFSTSAAQKKQNNATRPLVVKSQPPGAMVSIQGENSLVGITPFQLNPNFQGHYKLVVTKSGYENRKYEFIFTGREKGSIKLNLSPKTRAKAGMRSMIIPGWGQIYSERKTFGTIMSLLEISALIGTANSVRIYNHKIDDYENALKLYDANKKYYHLRELYWKTVETKFANADQAYQRQQTWIWIAGGIWLYNFLDSMMFFPSFGEKANNRSMPTLSTHFGDDEIGLKLSYSF